MHHRDYAPRHSSLIKMESLQKDMDAVGLRKYTLKELRLISRGFITKTRLGEVYKGVTDFEDKDCRRERMVTVKTWGYLFKTPQYRGTRSLNRLGFMNEISFLMKFSGTQYAIPEMFGYYYDKNNDDLFAVVYDFKSRDTLYNLINDVDFTWELRIQAVNHLACTLEFLHGQGPPPYRLGILDSACVMLDLSWNPVLLEFSITTNEGARELWRYGVIRLNASTIFLNHFACTCLFLVEEGDVFQFGSVLLELISKQKLSRNGEVSVSMWAEQEIINQENYSFTDSSFEGDTGFNASSAELITKMAMRCVKSKPRLLPSMKEVVQILMASKSPTNGGDDFDNLLKESQWIPSEYWGGNIRKYSLEELENLTGNFSEENSIGVTTFGFVYKGTTGAKVMVKTWGFANKHSIQNMADTYYNWFRFKNEITFLTGYISGCHHCIPKLNGYYCEDNDDMFAVVYEFEPRDTLLNLTSIDDFDWTSRISVALHLACLLEDLHGKDPPYKICNLEPANVMLDKSYKPVIFDFSLVSSDGWVDKIHSQMDHFPACSSLTGRPCMGGFSVDDDVFSFGMMLLTLMSKCLPERYRTNKSWAAEMYAKNIIELGRQSIASTSFIEGKGYNDSWAAIITEMAMRCIGHVGLPSIKEVLEVLEACHHFLNNRSNMETHYKGASDRQSKELPWLQNLEDFSSFSKLFEIHKTESEVVYVAKTEQDKRVTIKSWSGSADLVSSIWDLDICILSVPKVRNALGYGKLIGYYWLEQCNGSSIVYDFQAKGMLEKLIVEDGFTWSQRIAAALHIAKSVEFLHGWKPLPLSCDLRVEHIMLDKDFNPILCHFILAIAEDIDPCATSWHKGVCPIDSSEESFGDLLWCLISKSPEKMKKSKKACISVVDKCFRVDGEYDRKQGKKVAELARSCKFDKRITMTTIVARLYSIIEDGAQKTLTGSKE